MKPIIIGFNGRMGVGKTQAIKELTAYLDDRDSDNIIESFKFAQPLYDMQNFIYARVRRDVPSPKDRLLLQWLGTEWGRNTISDTLWVDLWAADVAEAIKNYVADGTPGRLVVVCDDVRFDNEAEKIKELGGKIVRITSERTGERIGLSGTAHASEQGISKKFVDYEIRNDGTLGEYQEALYHLFNELRVAE